MDMDSKEISSKWVTDSEILTKTGADLLQVLGTATTTEIEYKVYDGENNLGELKLDIKNEFSKSFEFPGGMYMRRGIYILADTHFQGCLVRWRNRPSKEG